MTFVYVMNCRVRLDWRMDFAVPGHPTPLSAQELKFGGGKEECLKLWQADGIRNVWGSLHRCLGLAMRNVIFSCLNSWIGRFPTFSFWKILHPGIMTSDGSLYLKYPYNNLMIIVVLTCFPTMQTPRPVLFLAPIIGQNITIGLLSRAFAVSHVPKIESCSQSTVRRMSYWYVAWSKHARRHATISSKFIIAIFCRIAANHGYWSYKAT